MDLQCSEKVLVEKTKKIFKVNNKSNIVQAELSCVTQLGVLTTIHAY